MAALETTTNRGEGKAKAGFGKAIRQLRRECGLSQNGLALRLGVTPHSVAQWEAERQEPNKWNYLALLKLAQECPSGETGLLLVRRLGDLVETRLLPRGAGKIQAFEGRDREAEVKVEGEADAELFRYFNDAAMGLNELFEAAKANRGAREELRHLADRLVKRSGDWRRMKYLKKKA